MAFNMPATPQRPTPGAFIQTPAPNRPGGLFRGGAPGQQGQQQAPALVPVPAPAKTLIERAADTINGMLEKDARYPDLSTYVKQGISADYEMATSAAWTPFQRLRTYEIPERIFEQINQVQMSTAMGLFAEINHAWVTIDNQLYLWDYTHPNPELVGYEDQPDNIVSVKLVKPRASVFVDTISYLLVVATQADIFLIAVECQRGPEGVHSVTLYRTGLKVSIRGIHVRAIQGSDKTGRIFFADGRDTEDVYELNYQQEDKWFSPRCSKTNHVRKSIGIPALPFYGTQSHNYVKQLAVDDTRNLLYSLSSNGTIRIFHLNSPTTLNLVITRTLTATKTSCGHLVRSRLLADSSVQIVGIDPISAPEATQLSLMATTSTGCRIFHSTTSGQYYGDDSAAPNSIQVLHIRLPPPTNDQPPAPGAGTQMQTYGATQIDVNSLALSGTTNTYRYAPGLFFDFMRRQNEPNHSLFMSAPHSGQIAHPQIARQELKYIESAQVLNLNGVMQDIGLVTEPFFASKSPLGFGNELAVQFDKPLSEFAIMTHNGVETIRRRRLVDIFAAIIKYGGGPDGIEGDMRKVVKQYGLAETATTALAVACGQGSDIGPDERIAMISDPEVLELARKAFIDYGGKPQLNENATVEGLNPDNVRASPRHDGIAMYIARLVRSIWRSPIILEKKTPAGIAYAPTHKVSKLQDVQRALVRLQEFLDDNKQFIDGLAGPDALGRATSRQDEVELQGENRALTSLLQMINNIIEGIAFVLVLFEERLEEIMLILAPDVQQRARQLTFEALFSVPEGKNLAKELVKAIVNRSIAKGSNVESVAEQLRRKCGSFCSSDDVVIFKAQENLQKAADAGANADRGRIMLNDSLRLFEQVAKSLSMENLTAAVDRYIQLEFYAGAIRLALKAAQEQDRANKALTWIKDGRPAHDPRATAYAKRTACYELVFKVIEAVDQAFNSQGPTPEGVVSQISRRKYEAYEQINSSDDEVFQNFLYDWYLTKGWADRLLEIQSPFVVDYLRRSSQTDLAHADLLWRYHAHYNDFLSAAEVQFELAKSAFTLSLDKRIEYLSRAKANASARANMNGFTDAPANRHRFSRQQLLKEISDHLDLANIQDDLLQKLRNETRLTGERRETVLATLNGPILALDDLYNDYADNGGYYDICLYIYHAADYRSLTDIRHTWTNIITMAHEEAARSNHTAPWELVANKVEEVGRRVNLNENVFPVQVVLQLLLHYDITNFTHDPIPPTRTPTEPDPRKYTPNLTWPIDTLIRLSAPYESLIATLEALWYSQEFPFDARANRKVLVKWTIYTTERWYEMSRREGVPFGGVETAIGVADVLRVVLGGGELGERGEREWGERGREIRERVEEVVR